MIKRLLGKTGWKISVIGFGAIKLPQLTEKQCDILLNSAIDLGINFIDTADCYGDSEEKIGKVLSKRRKQFYLSTKIDERDRLGVTNKLERSLMRLRTDYIDLVLFHDVRGKEYEAIFSQGGFEALMKAKEQGKVLNIGISIHHSLSMMKKVIDSKLFSALMIAYSPMDEDRLTPDIIPSAYANGIGLIAMKPLAGGKLGEIRGWDKNFFKGETPAQVSLRYILSNPCITCAIPGMTNLKELEENIKVAQNLRNLTLEETANLMNWIGDMGKGFCRNCGYCLPCPEGISIPDIFRLENYYENYDLKQWAITQYHSLPNKPDQCSLCKHCIEKCPFGVNIPDRLKEIHKKLDLSQFFTS
jgi:predicted aldo/keto reductase-like oxidoreductase